MRARLTVLLVLALASPSAAWVQPELADLTGYVRWGFDPATVNFDLAQRGYGYQLSPKAPAGDHTGSDYRCWSDHWGAVGALPTNHDEWLTGSFYTNVEGELIRSYIKQGDIVMLAAVGLTHRPDGYSCCVTATSWTYVDSEWPSLSPSITPAAYADHAATLAYDADLSGVNLDATGQIVPTYIVGDGFLAADFGSVVYAPADTTKRVAYGTLWTTRTEPLEFYLRRGDEPAVLQAVIQPQDITMARLRTAFYPGREIVNPFPAAICHGGGNLVWGDATGYGLGFAGLPPDAILANTVVNIENLELDGGFATLQIFYDPDAILGTGLDEETIRAYWYHDALGLWILAGDPSNTAKNPLAQFVLGGPTENLGDWGLDTVGNYAWANIDHASVYTLAGTPEPATLVLLAVGAALQVVIRKRHAKCRS